MLTRLRSLGLAAAILAVLLAAPAGGGERRPAQATGSFTVKTFNLPGEFSTPWQLSWIADGTDDGAIAFTDRGGNAIGVLDPTTGSTQRFPLSVITSPNGIAPIDFNRFAVAGTGGVAIFDRSGAGRITQLAMAGTRNFVIATDSSNRVFVPDFQNNDLRIIRPPYGGPADITKWALPAGCRGPTGVIPRTEAITILCQTTNNIVDLSPTGTLLRTTALPIANMGAQEARPGPRGGVFSGFNADRLAAWITDYPDPYDFVNVLLEGRRGPAVPTVGYFNDPAFQDRIATASRFLGQGRRPPVSSGFDVFSPSFRGDGFAIGAFPRGKALGYDLLGTRNLVGSALGPDGSIFVADATPGRPAIHRLTPNLFGKTGQNRVRFRYPVTRLTAVDKDFLVRMTYPFFGPGPSPRSTPSELQVGIVGSSSSPWHIGRTFSGSFDLNLTGRGRLPGGQSYALTRRSGDISAFGRVYTFDIRPRTRSVTLSARGTTQVPVSFGVHAQTPKPEPCECESLDVQLRVSRERTNEAETSLPLDWTLECTGGTGKCRGAFTITADKAARAAGIRFGHGSDLQSFFYSGTEEFDVRCVGDCQAPTTDTRYVTVKAPEGSTLGRDIRSVTVVVERTCRRQLGTKLFRIAFGAGGVVSARRSDLNGNGTPDGKEKR